MHYTRFLRWNRQCLTYIWFVKSYEQTYHVRIVIRPIVAHIVAGPEPLINSTIAQYVLDELMSCFMLTLPYWWWQWCSSIIKASSTRKPYISSSFLQLKQKIDENRQNQSLNSKKS